jgi:hypothetical protein
MAWQSHIVHDIYFFLAGITPCAPLLLKKFEFPHIVMDKDMFQFLGE